MVNYTFHRPKGGWYWNVIIISVKSLLSNCNVLSIKSVGNIKSLFYFCVSPWFEWIKVKSSTNAWTQNCIGIKINSFTPQQGLLNWHPLQGNRVKNPENSWYLKPIDRTMSSSAFYKLIVPNLKNKINICRSKCWGHHLELGNHNNSGSKP